MPLRPWRQRSTIPNEANPFRAVVSVGGGFMTPPAGLAVAIATRFWVARSLQIGVGVAWSPGQVEEPVGGLARHDRRKRPELLATLDVAVQAIADLDIVRRREQAAMAERARTKLAGALHPPDNPSSGQIPGMLKSSW